MSTRFSIWKNLTNDLTHVIVADMRAMFLYRDDRIRSFRDVQERGRIFSDNSPACLASARPPSSPTALRSSSTPRARPVRRRPP